MYSIIWKYWDYCLKHPDKGSCEITINQLKKLFKNRKNEEDYLPYKIMMNLFEHYGLIKIKRVGRQFKGNPYTAY